MLHGRIKKKHTGGKSDSGYHFMNLIVNANSQKAEQ